MLAKNMVMSSGLVWDGYIYYEGDEYTDITGGYYQSYGSGVFTKNLDHLSLQATASAYVNVTHYTGIDWTPLSNLEVKFAGTISGGSGTYGIRAAQGVVIMHEDTSLSLRTINIDISAITGVRNMVLRCEMLMAGYSTTFKIYSLRFS